MLVNFSIENFGPYRDEMTFSMEATHLSDSTEAYVKFNRSNRKILKCATLFGANASGKSYLFDAIGALQSILSEIRPKGMSVPAYIPFRLSRETLASPSTIRIEVIKEEILYRYSISYTSQRITEESLYHSPKGRMVPYFIRSKRNEGMDGDIKKRLTDSSAYLAVASAYNDDVCNKVLKEIMNIMLIHFTDQLSVFKSMKYSEDNNNIKEKILRALYAADLGISDFVGEEKKLNNGMDRARTYSDNGPKSPVYLDIKFIHQFKDVDVDKELMAFPINIESNGTVEMFALMGPIAKALDEGRTVFIDEFGADLHPMLTRWIVGLFNTDANENGAQLIVNTHDISLMDIRDLFRRDQIWFSNKDRRNGSCEIYSLSDFKGVLKDSDIRQEYLMGRYDALPWMIERHSI